MDEIRLGTVGSGVIVHSILDAAARTEGIRLCAVYSRSRDKGEALAAQYGPAEVYTDMDAFLADPEMNFVYIASPNSLHYEQAKKALQAGKNVILEKPFAPRLEQVRELSWLAEERGLYLIDAVPTTYLPNYGLLQNYLAEIGPVRAVMSNYSNYSSRYPKLLAGEKPNIFNPEFAGGVLMDLNIYNIYLNIALFGRPVHAAYYPHVYPGLADISGVMVMQYADFVSTNTACKDSNGVSFFQIQGERGFIYIPEGSNGLRKIRIVTRDTDKTLDRQEDPSRWYYEISGITKLVLAGDRQAFRRRLELTQDTIALMESARKEAGIIFPGDQ